MWYYATWLDRPLFLPHRRGRASNGNPNVCLGLQRQRKEKEKKPPNISIHPITVMIKHLRPQICRRPPCRREADRGRRFAKIAVNERSQIEYHPACQDGCEELLESMFFPQGQRERRFVGGRGTLTRLKGRNIGATITIAWDGMRTFFREMKKRRTGKVYIMMTFVMDRAIK